MVHKIFKTIQSFISKEKIPRLEQERFFLDIETAYERLQHGEYKYMDYSGKNKYNIPERTNEFFLYLESYCFSGKTWSYILDTLKVKSYKNVVDLCSGWAPKITLALFYSEYSGEVILFDQNEKSANLLKKFMRLFQPKYTIKKSTSDFFEYTGEGFDFIIANHVIDDLVLEYYCRKNKISSKNIYKQEGMVSSLWGEILQKDELLEEIIQMFTKHFSELVNSGGIICLAQYKSMIEGLLSLDASVAYNIMIMKEVAKRLESTGEFSILHGIPEKSFKQRKTAFSADECIILKKL